MTTINVNGNGATGVTVNGGTFIGTQNNFFIVVNIGDTRAGLVAAGQALAAHAALPATLGRGRGR
jgi:hypothetical protein